MIWERLFRWTLRQEMENWEDLHLLDTASLDRLRAHYGFAATHPEDRARTASTGLWTRWVLYLAIAAFLAGFFSFARGRDMDLGPTWRVSVLFLASTLGLLIGSSSHARRRLVGVVLLILGGMLLPITFYFAVHYYHLWTLPAPLLWWAGLGVLLMAGFAPLGQQWGEAGLAATALLNGLSVPFLWAVHSQVTPLTYSALAVGLALGTQLCRTIMTESWRAVWARSLGLAGYLLAAAACVLPVVTTRYDTIGAAAIYGLAACYFALGVRTSQHRTAMAPFVVALLAGVGALLRVGQVGFAYYPLVWLAVMVILLSVSLVFFRRQLAAMSALLDTLQALVWSSSIGFWLIRAETLHAPGLWRMTLLGYGGLALSLYGLAGRHQTQRLRLAYLAAWTLMAAFRLAVLEIEGLTLEHYTLLSGSLLLLNAMAFARHWQREPAMVPAVAMLAIPSLVLAWSDDQALRTILLALGGISLIGVGAVARNRRYLLMGAGVLIPAVAIKLITDLQYLGLPRFAWFAIFGILLMGIAWLLQQSTDPQSTSIDASEHADVTPP